MTSDPEKTAPPRRSHRRGREGPRRDGSLRDGRPAPAAPVHFPAKDVPLRDDVRVLGELLGNVLKEQGGPQLFDRVESARLAARRRRAGDPAAEAELAAALGALEPTEVEPVVRAFAHYFSLVNMAEHVHRVRRRREYLRPDSRPQRGSLEDVVRRLAAAGVGLDELRRILAEMAIVPVFTAHPTEAIRPALLVKEQRVARALVDRIDRAGLTPAEDAAALARVRSEVTAAWQTEEHVAAKRSVLDEVEHTLFYLREVVYRIVPPFYEALAEAVQKGYGEDAAEKMRGPFVRFASWVGGDMDGNPNAGPETIRATLARHRELILSRYESEVRELASHLTQSPSRVGVSEGVLERIRRYGERLPEEYARIPERTREMPYVVLLRLVSARLHATATGGAGAYPEAEAFLDDLRAIAASLLENRGRHGGHFRVRRLIRRVETFGFHLATLDVRQHAAVHRRAVGELLGDRGFAERPPPERRRLLEAALADLESEPTGPATRRSTRSAASASRSPAAGPSPRLARRRSTRSAPGLSQETEPTLDVMRAIRESLTRYGPRALGLYIISMAEGPDDPLALLYLARRAGLLDDAGRVPLDIAPLFETAADLAGAGATLEALLADPVYRRHLEARGREQVVMIGYSDSNKESGLTASRWALYRSQADLVEAARAGGIELTIFHGRGGTASRGGSKPRAAILAEPPGAVSGRLRVTEQGEIIHAKYGLRGIAERTLELMAGAVLEVTAEECRSGVPSGSEAATAASGGHSAPVAGGSAAAAAPGDRPGPPTGDAGADPGWTDVMEGFAHASRQAYRALVYGDSEFPRYFREATPIDVIERMPIGSRPPARRGSGAIEDLRAIPWVFAWTQSRLILPGWFGVGTGLERTIERHGIALVRTMARTWPVFGNLISDVEMVLAKADMPIATRYAALAGEVSERIHPLLLDEFERTRRLVCEVQEVDELLDREPVLQRAIRLRNPYVDPMSLVQVELLGRWRASGRSDPELERALFTTVKGIARGLQNTG